MESGLNVEAEKRFLASRKVDGWLRNLDFRYVSWVSEPVTTVFADEKGRIHQFLSPKRGNAAYMRRLERRLMVVREVYRNINFRPRDTDVRLLESGLLFVTLTYDPKRIGLEDAWRGSGKHFNLWITKIRRKFGPVVHCIRAFESMWNGMPHIHVLLWFPNRRFAYLVLRCKYRLADRNCRNLIRRFWYHGFTDIQLCITGKYATEYIIKYILKCSDSSNAAKSVRNYALLWHYKKRSFAVGRWLADLTRVRLHNSNFFELGLGSPAVNSLGVGAPRLVAYLKSPVKWAFLGINTLSGFVPKEEFHKHMKSMTDREYHKRIGDERLWDLHRKAIKLQGLRVWG